MAQESVKGMLQTLDPHSYFLDPDGFARMSEEQRGKYFGIGIQIQKQEDRLVVIAPIEGGPAWRLGVQAGRRHHPHQRREHQADLRPGRGRQAPRPQGDEGQRHVRPGGAGEAVRADHHPGGDPALQRPLRLHARRRATGYIFIRYFAETTTEELKEKLAALTKQGMKSLVLDLRGNAGGRPLPGRSTSRTSSCPRARSSSRSRAATGSSTGRFPRLANNQYEKIPLDRPDQPGQRQRLRDRGRRGHGPRPRA